MSNPIYLTKEGRDNLLQEHKDLIKRKCDLSEEVGRAREHGDLRENAEYHAAKESLTNVGRRIAEIESKLTRVKLIENQNIEKDKVYIGCTVEICFKGEEDESFSYTIVDVEEANPDENKISVQSPIAQGLLGHKEGDLVKIKLQARTIEYKVLKITY